MSVGEDAEAFVFDKGILRARILKHNGDLGSVVYHGTAAHALRAVSRPT